MQEQHQLGDVNANSFVSLKHLRVKTASGAALALAGVMPALKELVLDVPTAPAELLPCMAQLPTRQQLCELALSAEETVLSWPALLALRGLPQLQTLQIHAGTPFWSSADGTKAITGEYLRSFLSLLSRLHTLGITAPLPIHADVLGVLGEACLKLSRLQLNGLYNLPA